MVDQEVENTLREIRERVRAEAATRAPAAGAPADANAAPVARVEPAARGSASDAVARMHANAATTERAWSRLPPVMSYRAGALARLELWLKRLVKRAAHWFTWEQVNFNSAVHHSLADAREALAAHEQLLARLQSDFGSVRESLDASLRQLRAEVESDRARAEARSADFGTRLAAAEARINSEVARMSDAIAAAIEQLRAEQATSATSLSTGQREITDALRDEQQSHASALRQELREHFDRLLEEQRVCFRQLSLESTEAAVMQDRARRSMEARLEALEEDVNRES